MNRLSLPPLMICAALLLVLSASPADAGPLVGIVTSVFTAVSASPFLTAIFKLAGSVVLSKLSAKLGPKPRQPGIKSEVTLTGAINPCSFVLGRYATNGAMVCPPMSHGSFNGVPNAFLTLVIELGDVPGQTLEGIWVDGTYVPFAGSPAGSFGTLITAGKYANNMWIKYHDGSQTAADPMLMATYASHPERPWSADMVGRGICYVVLNFLVTQGLFDRQPECRFVVGGVPLYDPRKDSTVGGVGNHRWADKATWQQTNNPQVMAYNLHRGVAVAGHTYGGRSEAADLPLTTWFAAMNACDQLVNNGQGGIEPAFRAGYEVYVSEEPAAVLEELMKASLAEAADMGGRWLVQVDDAGLPVWTLDDDSLIITKGGDRSLFPGPQDTWNAIAAKFPDPAVQWESSPATLKTSILWEAQDGGVRRTVSVDYPAVPYPAQVQRLMAATIEAERRFLTHSEVLPPEALALDLLDTVDWDSALFGYNGDQFQIGRLSEDLQTGVISVMLRERAPVSMSAPGGNYYTPPPVISSASGASGGPIAAIALGPSSPIAIASQVIDAADTGWVAVASTAIPDPGTIGLDQSFAALITVALTGATVPKALFWRLRITMVGGSTVDAFVRADMLLPGQTQTITCAGPVFTATPIINLAVDVSGRGLAGAEEITITAVHYRAFIRNR